MIRRLALAMVRRYPAAWRERHEAEASALIDDSPVRFGDLGELLRGLISERARELVAADDRPRRTAAVLTWMPAVFMLTLTAAAAALGLLLRRIAGPWSTIEEEVLGWAIVSILFALLAVHIVTRVRHRRRPQPKPPVAQTPAWVASLLLPCVFIAVVCATWADVLFAQSESDSLPWGLHVFIRGYLYFMLLDHLTSSLWPRRDLLYAFGALEAAEGWLRVNEAWVVSCREWLAKGVSSPLEDALAQVGYWTIERDSAQARLQELGYRPRFQWPPTSR
jgi:hypothetical protein